MKAVFTLVPSESRRLLAKATVAMPEVQVAKEKAYIILCGGVTNGFIAQELLGIETEPQRCTAGISSKRMLCVTPEEERHILPMVIYKGEPVDKTMQEAFEDFHIETVVIKGGNAIDPEGNVGVITSGFDGGTIAATIGTVTSTGLQYIFPIGLEKLVPSVRDAVQYVGAKTFDYSLGANFGMYCISKGKLITEIEALKILANVEAKHIASGGVGGSEGAVVLVAWGGDDDVKKAISIVESIKGEPPVQGLIGDCEVCKYDCRYQGFKYEDLPEYLK
ncbi:TPA: hypothetical protein EYP66_23640 [Candidatus Poribacteria bacterium]|nr:hypothetical protein [Candidatus Poribacteria bacterium]